MKVVPKPQPPVTLEVSNRIFTDQMSKYNITLRTGKNKSERYGREDVQYVGYAVDVTDGVHGASGTLIFVPSVPVSAFTPHESY
jgi:hypothetical protein